MWIMVVDVKTSLITMFGTWGLSCSQHRWNKDSSLKAPLNPFPRIHNIFAVQVFQVIIVAYTLRFGLYKTEVIFLAYSYKWDRYWNGLKKFK